MKLSDNEVLKAVDELYQQIFNETSPSKKDNCKFYGANKGRYCLATTHKRCTKCRMFEPTIIAKFRALVENTEKLKQEIKSLTIEKKSLALKIKMLESMMADDDDEVSGNGNL